MRTASSIQRDHGLAAAAVVFLAMAIALGGWLAPASAQVRMMPPGSLPEIDEDTQAAIIDSLITVLDSTYVMADEGAQMVEHLSAGWAEGKWRDLTDPSEFVSQLDREIHGVYDDGHLGLVVMPPRDPNEEAEEFDPRDNDEFFEGQRRKNYGFMKAEILAGNVGYLRLDQFADTGRGGATGVAAMNFLANADALIIDLRGNGGGSASMIQLLAGYLLEDSEHLINWYVRARDETVQSWSQAYVPGIRIPDTPLYILTSGRTFSAAEEFTFDMKNLERATIVGETTGGGGNTVASYAFAFENFQVGMRASWGAATDPRSGEGWEGVGVEPHIAVEADLALDTSHRHAVDQLIEEAPSEDRFDLEWAKQDLMARFEPVTLDREELKAYVGDYGPRHIYFEGDQLTYRRESRPPMPLLPMATDLFRVGDISYFRLRFERGDNGDVTGLVGMYDNGREDVNPRD